MRPAVRTQQLDIPGPEGAIEALLEIPEQPLPAVAVVCHPHPLHQGTMHNKVVHTLARTFYRLGAAALRFNFRGVGRSAGRHADGEGELEDALAVARWAAAERPDASLFLAGFSFGAMVALRAAPRLDALGLLPRGLVTVAPPVARMADVCERPPCPWLVVHGEKDELVPLDGVRAWLEKIDSAPSLVVVDGATHFFHGALGALGRHVADFAAPLLTRAESPRGAGSLPAKGGRGAATC